MNDKKWHTLAIPLNCPSALNNITKVTEVLNVSAKAASLAVADIALTSKPNADAYLLSCSD